MGKTLFVTDLDGTLLSSDSRVSARSAQLLNEAIDKGALFTIATARTPSTVERLMRDVKANLPFIVMTGSAIWNPADGLFTESTLMPPETAQKILDTVRNHDLPTFIYQLEEGKIHIYHTGELSDNERKFISERCGSQYKIFHIPENGTSKIPESLTNISLFYSMQPTRRVEETFADIKANIECTPIFYHDMFGEEIGIMEIFSPAASKANAIKRLKIISGADRVVAFGDNINDIPMLREADVAVAVENAVPEVKSIADVIIGANTTDAVPRFILSALNPKQETVCENL